MICQRCHEAVFELPADTADWMDRILLWVDDEGTWGCLDDHDGIHFHLPTRRPLRTLRITNTYELYDNVVTTVDVELLLPVDFDTDAEYDEYLYDTIFPLTGVGHEDGNSAYFVESIDDLEPKIDEEYGT